MSKPIRVLFDAYHLYHLPQFDPVIDLLTHDPRFEVGVTTSALVPLEERNITQRMLRARSDVECIFCDDEAVRVQAIQQWSPDVFMVGWSRYNSLHEYVPAKTVVGMIYHGIGVKPSYWRDNDARLDVRFVEGSFRVDQLRQKGVTTDLDLVGFSKLDPVFNSSLSSREIILRDLGLDPAKKTVLYAPTFYPSSFEPLGEKLAAFTQDYNLIIKLHMWVHFKDAFGADLRPQLNLAEKLAARYPHIVSLQPEHYNIVPLMHASDVLVTEASSTLYEMMALDKPVILCQFYKLRWTHRLFKQRLYRLRLDEEMTNEMTDFCIKAAKPKDLPAALRKALENPEVGSERIKRYQDTMFYLRDGKVSERIRDSLIRRVEQRRNSVAVG